MTADVEAEMTTRATAELLVLRSLADASSALEDAATTDGLDIELPADARSSRWAGGIVALRWEGRWIPGRSDGTARVDLVGIGARRTLLRVELEQPGGRLQRGVTSEAAHVLARWLRDGIERARPACAPPRGAAVWSRDRTVLVARHS